MIDEVRKQSRLRRWVGASAMVLALSTTMVAVPVTPAGAHTNGHSSCITNWKEYGWWTTYLKARNDCDHTINIKFAIRFSPDSRCYEVAAGKTLTWDTEWGSARGKGVPC